MNNFEVVKARRFIGSMVEGPPGLIDESIFSDIYAMF